MDAKPLPDRPSLEQYKKQAKDLVKARTAVQPDALRAWATRWMESWSSEWTETQARLAGRAVTPELGARLAREIERLEARVRSMENVTLAGAQLFIAREHGFASWPRFATYVQAVAREQSPDREFETAVEAIVAGDLATLERSLRDRPDLIRARSSRKHGATLLHYLGANGVEDYRQITPPNAVEVLNVLLSAGAEVDAIAEMYGKDTTLGLVATSVHPVRAGVQEALMARLLAAGAAIDGVSAAGSIVNACLANGRGAAARFLADRGARLDFEGAAGVGRVAIVTSYYGDRGRLEPSVTPAQVIAGFGWACEYGHDQIIELLLRNGCSVAVSGDSGQTGLHWAVIGGQLETVKLLLRHGAPLDLANRYGGTPLGQAMWCVEHAPELAYAPIVRSLVDAGANLDAEPGLRDAVEAYLAR
jgi:hypothetical protein